MCKGVPFKYTTYVGLNSLNLDVLHNKNLTDDSI